jgi:thiol-disulfide isomerase/thioredoxin
MRMSLGALSEVFGPIFVESRLARFESRSEGDMRLRFVALALSIAVSLSTAHSRVTLRVGDPAPMLPVMVWIKGEPVNSFQPGKVYVVEFWATWCGPCQIVMPHLSALQQKYDGRLTVIGVNAREADNASGAVAVVRKFVLRKGDQMNYTVGMDDPKTHPVFDAWMTAAGAYGIPTTFIVDRSGRIAWIGHPSSGEAEFDAALDQALEGKSDLAAARSAQAELNHETARSLQEKKVFGTLDNLKKRKRYADALVEADRLIGEDPRRKPRVFGSKLVALLHIDEARAFEYVKDTAADPEFMKEAGFSTASDDRYINYVASVVASEDNLSPTAYAYAVNHLSSDVTARPDELYSYLALAQAYYHLHDYGHAISTQQAAIERAENQINKEDAKIFIVGRMRETLARYQNAHENQK